MARSLAVLALLTLGLAPEARAQAPFSQRLAEQAYLGQVPPSEIAPLWSFRSGAELDNAGF